MSTRSARNNKVERLSSNVPRRPLCHVVRLHSKLRAGYRTVRIAFNGDGASKAFTFNVEGVFTFAGGFRSSGPFTFLTYLTWGFICNFSHPVRVTLRQVRTNRSGIAPQVISYLSRHFPIVAKSTSDFRSAVLLNFHRTIRVGFADFHPITFHRAIR